MSGSVIYTPVPADLLSAFKLHYPAFQPKRLFLFLVFAAFVGLAASLLSGDTDSLETLKVMAAMVVFGAAIFVTIQLVLRLWWMPRYTARIYKQQAELRQEVEVTWDEIRFSTRSSNAHSDMAWKDFHRWSRNDRMMLLYRSEALFNFFPLNTAEKQAAADSIQLHLETAGVARRP